MRRPRRGLAARALHAAALAAGALAAAAGAQEAPASFGLRAAPGATEFVLEQDGAPALQAAEFRDGPRPAALAAVRPDASGWTLRLRLEEGREGHVRIAADGERLWLRAEDRRFESLVLRGRVRLGPDAFLARLDETGDGILQLRSGRVGSRRCNAFFDPQSGRAFASSGRLDRAAWEARGELRVEVPLQGGAWLEFARRPLQERHGLPFFAPLDRERFPLPPAGWCSWYHAYRDITPEHVLANARWLARELAPCGARWVQIDDGWQGENGTDYGDVRDWTRLSPRFPGGMKALADEIRALGLLPGIWLAPHGQSNPDLFREHPEWFLRDAEGNPVGSSWEGRYLLDPTHDGARAYLARLFETMAWDWGYRYFKVDGQPIVLDLYRRLRERFADPRADPVEAWRETLRILHGAIGPDAYLLGCWGQPREGIGILDGCRTGGDVVPDWSGARTALAATKSGLWLNNLCWWSDPDCLLVREPLALEEARCWAALLALTGQALMASDDLPALPPERVEILRRVFPPHDLRPLDLYPARSDPRIVDVRVAGSPGEPERDVVGLFNWGNAEKVVHLNGEELGWEEPGGPRLVFDLWRGRFLGLHGRRFPLSVPAHGAAVLLVQRPPGAAPRFLASSRHLLSPAGMGLALVRETEGGGAEARTRHEFRGPAVPGDAGWAAFWMGAGDGRRLRMSAATDEEGPLEFEVQGAVAVVRLRPAAGTARSVTLQTGGAEDIPPPRLLRLNVALDDTVPVLHWEAGGAAPPVRIERDGRLVAVAADSPWADPEAPPGREARYEVAFQGGGPGAERLRAQVRTPPARDTRLQDLRPLQHSQGWGAFHGGASVEGNPLRVGGTPFSHGLGTHAPSRTEYRLWGAWKRFTAQVGVDDEVGAGPGSVVFRVWADGVLLWESPLRRAGDPPVRVEVDVSGRQLLALETLPGPDNMDYDHADWAEAALWVE